MFPAQAEARAFFNSESRCLIDMGNVFIVMPPQGDNLQPYQRFVFRLEVQRQNVEFPNDSRLSKDACLALLKAKFNQLPYCDIVGVNFPFFGQGEVGEGQNKYRPCVALYGDDDEVPMYIGVHMGAPTDAMAAAKDNQFCLLLKPSTDVLPPTASIQMVQLTALKFAASQICTTSRTTTSMACPHGRSISRILASTSPFCPTTYGLPTHRASATKSSKR